MHFENVGSLRAPFLGLLVSLVIYVELVQEGLDITLVLCGHKAILEALSEVHLLVDVPLYWCLSASSASW